MSDENNRYENKINEDNENQQPVNEQPVNNTHYNPYSGPVYNNSSNNSSGTGLGIASMVCGIVSIPIICCASWFGFFASFVLGVVAVVLGIVQIVKYEKKGMAIAGIACGGVGILLCVFIIILALFFAGAELFSDFSREYNYRFY